MSEFCQCNVIAPIVLLNIDPVAHELLYPLVVTFRLPISTGMKSGGNILFDMTSFAKFSHELAGESGIAIADDLSGEAKSRKDMCQEQVHNSFGCDSFVAWNE